MVCLTAKNFALTMFQREVEITFVHKCSVKEISTPVLREPALVQVVCEQDSFRKIVPI